jgi:glucokinase
MMVVGVDIGGSHITAAVVDTRRMEVLPGSVSRCKVDAGGTADDIINAWSEVIGEALRSGPGTSCPIGVAMPGPFDYANGISYIKGLTKYDSLYEANVKLLLERKLGVDADTIKFKNDAACFLQGEVLGGAARGYACAIGLTIGTGSGTARYRHGESEDAELWQMPFREAIVEEYISTRWFVRRYLALSGKQVTGVKELCHLYAADKLAKAVFSEFSENLAAFLHRFILMEAPEVVVLGGNIVHASGFFLPMVEERLRHQCVNVPIKKSMLGENAALIGAAACWMQ